MSRAASICGQKMGLWQRKLWRLRDQTGNRRAAAEHNAKVEGVSERVELVDADARDLPFPANSFDVVVSNLTFDNIHGTEERARALREVVRVLVPSGRMCIVDDRADRYAAVLRMAGCSDVEVRRLDWRTSAFPAIIWCLSPP